VTATGTTVPIRLAVVDDHPAIHRALTAAAAAVLDIDVVGVATDVAGAEALIGRDDVDIVLLDLQLAGGADGLRVLEGSDRSGRPGIVVLSAYDYPALVRRAFELGAAGYLLKTESVDEVLAAVRVVAAGGTAYSAERLRSIRLAPRPPSPREQQVLHGVVGGSTNDEIAARLGISLKTVESHLRRMFDRYGVLSRTELAVMSVRDGWLAAGARPDR
jgi:DNA-binding NarL/FixJ family response regulator